MGVARKASERKDKPASSRPGRTRLELEERRAQLVALGLDLFGARPYDEVSIDDVARAAGISKGLLYHYFPTKRHFYLAGVRESARRLLAVTLADRAGAAPERLRAGLDAYLGYVDRQGPAYLALLRGGVGSDAEVAAVVEETRAAFARSLLENLPELVSTPLVRTTIRGWIGFVEAASLDWVEHHDIERRRLTDLLVELLLHSLSAAMSDARPR